MQTWLQEANGNVELAASAAAAYGADVNDLALSDDGTCFFWRDSRVHLMRSSLSSVALQLPLPAFAIAVQRKAAVFCGWSKAGMKFVLSQPPRAFPAESNRGRATFRGTLSPATLSPTNFSMITLHFAVESCRLLTVSSCATATTVPNTQPVSSPRAAASITLCPTGFPATDLLTSLRAMTLRAALKCAMRAATNLTSLER